MYFERYANSPFISFSMADPCNSGSMDHGCQGEFWKFNSVRQKWEGNPIFDPEYKVYFKSLKNCNRCTETSTQVLPILPADLNMLMQYLDSEVALRELGETKCLYFKAFAMTAFSLWTR
jgi:hypothetical protein